MPEVFTFSIRRADYSSAITDVKNLVKTIKQFVKSNAIDVEGAKTLLGLDIEK